MRARATLLSIALASTLLPATARASTLIGAGNLAFTPSGPTLTAGTAVTWRNNDMNDIHSVTAYYGASFASGTLNFYDTFTTIYGGGTVLYRCLYYSALDTSVSPPRCSGMCGTLQPSTPDVTAPTATITTPDGFLFTGGVRIDGTAVDDRAVARVTVALKPLLTLPPVLVSNDGTATCGACGQPNVAWVCIVNPLGAIGSLPPGQYSVTATATDAAGNSAATPPVTIYVAA